MFTTLTLALALAPAPPPATVPADPAPPAVAPDAWAACPAGAAADPPGTRYFLALFSYQNEGIARPKHAHTFATVMKATPGAAVEAHTISWLPTTGNIRVYAVRSEPGRNYTLDETARLARADGARVALWGPFEIRDRLYTRVVERKADLDSGRFRYRAVDNLIRETDVVDCIHALTDVDPLFNRGRYPLHRYGDRATDFIAHEMRSRDALLDGARVQEWLMPALEAHGLAGHPVVRKEMTAAWRYPLADVTLALRPQSRMVRR